MANSKKAFSGIQKGRAAKGLPPGGTGTLDGYDAQQGVPHGDAARYGGQRYSSNVDRTGGSVPSSAGPSVLPRKAPFALKTEPHPEAHPDRAALHGRGTGEQD